MWNWLEKLGLKPKSKDNDVVVIKSAPTPVAPVSANVVTTETNTASSGPVSNTPVVSGLEERERVNPEDLLQKPLEKIKHVIATSIEKGAKGPHIVNVGGNEVFVPGESKPEPPKVEPVPTPAPVPEPVPVPVPAPEPAPEPQVIPETPKAAKVKGKKIKGKKKRTK